MGRTKKMKMDERKRMLPMVAKGRVNPPTSYRAPPMTGPTISPVCVDHFFSDN